MLDIVMNRAYRFLRDSPFGGAAENTTTHLVSTASRESECHANGNDTPASIMAASTSRASRGASIPRPAWLFYVVGALLLLAFVMEWIQDDGFDWILLGAAAASLVAGVASHRKPRRRKPAATPNSSRLG